MAREPSFEALALLTTLQNGHDQDSSYVREEFSQVFPESDYAECLAELRDAGLIDEPVPMEEPRGVRFNQLSPLHLRSY